VGKKRRQRKIKNPRKKKGQRNIAQDHDLTLNQPMKANQRIVRILNQNLHRKNPIEKKRKNEAKSIEEGVQLLQKNHLFLVQEVVLVLHEEEDIDATIVMNHEEKEKEEIDIEITEIIEKKIIEKTDMKERIENMEADQEQDHPILY